MLRGERKIVNRATPVLLVLISSVIFNATAAQAQQCIRNNPTVTIQPANQSAFPGNQLIYTVTVTNNDSAACGVSTFAVVATFPEEGFKHTPDRVRFTITPGESRSRSVVIRAPGGSCAGSKSFRETAVNESAPSFSGFADAIFDVTPIVPDCGRMAPTVSIVPASQQGASGDQLTYLVTVKNNDNPACGGSDFIVTPTLSIGLTAHTPDKFTLFVPANGTASRAVVVRSDLFPSGVLTFRETATHACATCLTGSATGVFDATPTVLGFVMCCSRRTPGTIGTTYDNCTTDLSNCLGRGCEVICPGATGPDVAGLPFTYFDTTNACSCNKGEKKSPKICLAIDTCQ